MSRTHDRSSNSRLIHCDCMPVPMRRRTAIDVAYVGACGLAVFAFLWASMSVLAPSYADDDVAEDAVPGQLHRKSAENLKQIALATHYHHDTYACFPAGYSADPTGRPLLSWRVHVLPFLGQRELYDRFRLDEPWDSPHNKELLNLMPEVFRSPLSQGAQGMTNYLGLAGADGAFARPQNGDKQGFEIRQFRDGTSNTALVIEVPDQFAIEWTKPGDFAPTKEWLDRLEAGRFQVVRADGSAWFFAGPVRRKLLQAMFTKAGGEPTFID